MTRSTGSLSLALLTAGMFAFGPGIALADPDGDARIPQEGGEAGDEGPAPEGEEGGDEGDEGAEGDDKKSKKEKRKERKQQGKRELAPEAPEAEALRALLATEANYAADGTVEIRYTFKEPEHTQDWDSSGFDRAEEAGNKGGRRRRNNRGEGRTRLMLLNAGSQRAGLLLHRLHMGGNYEVEFDLQVRRMTGRSDLVFAVGKGGVRFGDTPVRRSGSGFKPLARGGGEAGREALASGRRVKVKLQIESGVLTAWLNGTKVAETKKLDGKLEGRIGVYAKDASLVLHQVDVRGEIDPRKLD
jgi:hypothetical protein